MSQAVGQVEDFVLIENKILWNLKIFEFLGFSFVGHASSGKFMMIASRLSLNKFLLQDVRWQFSEDAMLDMSS